MWSLYKDHGRIVKVGGLIGRSGISIKIPHFEFVWYRPSRSSVRLQRRGYQKSVPEGGGYASQAFNALAALLQAEAEERVFCRKWGSHRRVSCVTFSVFFSAAFAGLWVFQAWPKVGGVSETSAANPAAPGNCQEVCGAFGCYSKGFSYAVSGWFGSQKMGQIFSFK